MKPELEPSEKLSRPRCGKSPQGPGKTARFSRRGSWVRVALRLQVPVHPSFVWDRCPFISSPGPSTQTTQATLSSILCLGPGRLLMLSRVW